MRWPNKRAGRIVRFWASGEAKFPKICDSLPWTAMNCQAKFHAASFILSEEIRTVQTQQKNKQKKQTNKQ